MAFIIQGAVKGLATGIGLASESHHARKEKKALQKQAEESGIPENVQREIAEHTELHEFDPEKRHEVVWELDEGQSDEDDKSALPDYDHKDGKGIEKPEKVVDAFLARHPPPSAETVADEDYFLALPVVIPQRRPQARNRGFIRAYAPLLEGAGVEETMFLELIHDLNVICLPDPKINAINLASFATQALPTVTGIVISRVIYKISQAALEAHSRTKMNKYLDLMNEKFFKPRRLFCLVMTWNPSDPAYQTDLDLSQTLTLEMTASNSLQSSSGMSKAKHALRVSSGEGAEFEFPETAPLVFPGLDAKAFYDPKDLEGKKTKSKIKSGKRFVDDYLDKRAHAKWAGQNPDSKLAQTVKTSFKSRYADPNHAAASGDPLALITGGMLSSTQLMAARGRGFGGGFGGRGGMGGGYGGNGSGGGGMGRGFGGAQGRGFGGGFDHLGGYDRFGGQGMGGGYDRFGGRGTGGRFGGGFGGGGLGGMGRGGGWGGNGGYNQGGYNQGGYNQGGYNQGGYNQGGYNQGGYNQGGYNQGGYDQGMAGLQEQTGRMNLSRDNSYQGDQPPGYDQSSGQGYPQEKSPSPNPPGGAGPQMGGRGMGSGQRGYGGMGQGQMGGGFGGNSMAGGGFGGGMMGMSPIGLIIGGGKNLLQKNILYLMIVQMPSDEELAEAAKMEASGQQ